MTFDLTESLDFLARTPAVFDRLLRPLPASWLAADEGPGTWSAGAVIGHLIHGEDTDWVPRTRHMLEHGDTIPFARFDREAMRSRFAGWDLPALLDRLAAARAASVEGIRSLRLTPADLARRGLHPELGPVTLGNHLASWVVHDLTHLAQVERVLAKRLTADVGPWTAYLSILQR